METMNRNNYEEYFLLYMDKELSADENKMVEDFLQKNPDLALEYNSLIEVKLHPDHLILFNNKNELTRHESFIHSGNYTEMSLLYIDKELSNEENIFVEKFYGQHPELKHELDALQSTILPAEHIIFSDKKSLYKHEGKVRYMAWKKYALAAAVLLFIFAAWLLYPAKTDIPITAKTNTGEPLQTEKVNQQPGTKNDSQKNSVLKTPQNELVIVAEENNQAGKKESKDGKKVLKNNVPQVHNAPVLVANNISPKEKITVPTANNDLNIISEREKLLNEKESVADNKDYSIATYTYEPPAKTIQAAAYKELDTSPEDDNTLAIGTIAINKEKLNGLLKKAGSLFGKKAKEEKNEKDVKVANLKINYN
ncbi:MAG: hypothetical protein ABIY35_03060 [Chitinophagaceae bacterium]